jgi:hypothetical protein
MMLDQPPRFKKFRAGRFAGTNEPNGRSIVIRAQHIPRTLVLAKAAGEELYAGTLMERLRGVSRVTLESLPERISCE